MIGFSSFLKELEPYSDKFCTTPISEKEIDAIEKRLDIKFPKYFREFLNHIGLRQDLVSELCNSFDAIIEIFEELPNGITQDYFPIGYSGEGLILLDKKSSHHKIFYFDGETKNIDGIEEWYTDFDGLLKNSSAVLKHTYKDLVYNSEKKWVANFKINTNNEMLIYETLNAKLLKNWEDLIINEENVNYYKSNLLYEGQTIAFFKSKHKGWDTPMYAFTIEIPFLEIKDDNIITRTEDIIKSVFPSYEKTDFGIFHF